MLGMERTSLKAPKRYASMSQISPMDPRNQQVMSSLAAKFPDMPPDQLFRASSQMVNYQEALKRQALSDAANSPMETVPQRKDGGGVRGSSNPNLHPHGMAHRVGNPPGTEGQPSPMSVAGRRSGLAQFYQNQARLGLENAAKQAVDPISGLSQTPTQAEINAQLQMLQSKPEEFPGFSGFDQALLMADYYNAKQSGDPRALEAASAAVSDYKNKLNALRAQKIRGEGGNPYVVNEEGTEAFKPKGGPPQAIPGGGPQVTSFPTDGKIIPAGRTAQLMQQGKVAPPPETLGEGVMSRDSMGNANLGTGAVYSDGAGKRQLFSKYGTGSSVQPTPPPQPPPDNLDMALKNSLPQGNIDLMPEEDDAEAPTEPLPPSGPAAQRWNSMWEGSKNVGTMANQFSQGMPKKPTVLPNPYAGKSRFELGKMHLKNVFNEGLNKFTEQPRRWANWLFHSPNL